MKGVKSGVKISDEALSRAVIDAAKREDMTVEALTEVVLKEFGVKEERFVKILYSLLKAGKVKLEDPNPPRNLPGYACSNYSLWFWGVLIFSVFTAASIYLFPQEFPYVYLRYILGALFILYLPGFVLLEALYPTRIGLTSLERVAFSVGLSLALVPLVGLILNYTPWGIRLNPIFASLSLLSVLLALTALTRRFTYFKLRGSSLRGLESEDKRTGNLRGS